MKGILDLDHIPSGMELFPAADEDQFEYIKQVIAECDYYVLIIGARYGAVNEEGISYTEREYDYAVESGKNVIALVHGAVDQIPFGKTERDNFLAEKLINFRERASTGRLVSFWTSKENLQSSFLVSLVHATKRYPGIGWVRADTVPNLEVLTQLNEVRTENVNLKIRLNELKSHLRPVIENAADLDDVFKVRYNWSEYHNGAVNKRHGELEMAWREIFKAVAYQLKKPTSTSQIDIYVSSFLFQERHVSKQVTINALDAAQMKTQLDILGLLKVRVLQTTKGGTDEFMELTALGERMKTELMAVRKRDP